MNVVRSRIQSGSSIVNISINCVNPVIVETDRFCRRRLEEPDDTANQVTYVAKGPGLRAIAINSKGKSAECLDDKIGDDPAVIRPHSPAIGIEYSDNPRVEPVEPVVGHRHRFSKSLSLIINAPRANGVDISPILLGLRVLLRVAVYLGCRCEQEPSPLFLGQP